MTPDTLEVFRGWRVAADLDAPVDLSRVEGDDLATDAAAQL